MLKFIFMKPCSSVIRYSRGCESETGSQDERYQAVAGISLFGHTNISDNKRRANLFVIGLFTGIIQLMILREIMNLAGGYELVTGSLFFIWLALSAAGALSAGRLTTKTRPAAIILLPLTAPLAQVILIASSRFLLSPGEYASFTNTLLISAATLLPVSFLSGFLFVKLSARRNRSDKVSPGSGFAIETTGGITAGILVALAGGGTGGNHTIIVVTALSALVLFTFINFRLSRIISGLTVVTGVMLILITSLSGIDRIIRSLLLNNITIEQSTDSRYGNISVAEYRGERSILYNHNLHSFTGSTMPAEENIHYVMLQHPSPASILVISGGINDHYRELRKYNTVERVFYLERDPLLIETEASIYDIKDDSVLSLVSEDAWSWIKKAPVRFDIIIVLIEPPATFEGNRYFSDRFYRSAKEVIAPGGYLMTLAGESSEYTGEATASSLSVISHTLGKSFLNVMPVRGNSIYMIASDSDINLSFAELSEERGIENEYVNKYYIDTHLTRLNSEMLLEIMKGQKDEVNRLINPVLVRLNQAHKLSKERNGYIVTGIILLALTLIPFASPGERKSRIWGATFTLAGTEIVALILLQSTLGTLYQFTGILIASLMAGLAAGAYGSEKPRIKEQAIPLLTMALTAVTALLSGLILNLTSTALILLILSLLLFIPGFLTGRLYNLATSSDGSVKNVSSLYTSDLAGSAAGFLAASWFLVPGTGVRLALFTIAFINFVIWLL